MSEVLAELRKSASSGGSLDIVELGAVALKPGTYDIEMLNGTTYSNRNITSNPIVGEYLKIGYHPSAPAARIEILKDGLYYDSISCTVQERSSGYTFQHSNFIIVLAIE